VQRLALVLAALAVIASGLAAPGPAVALGLGIAAIGTGRVAYARRTLPGSARLAGAAAITIGCIACLLGGLRIAMTLAAIGHLERMLGVPS
jgi:hypothetical protein